MPARLATPDTSVPVEHHHHGGVGAPTTTIPESAVIPGHSCCVGPVGVVTLATATARVDAGAAPAPMLMVAARPGQSGAFALEAVQAPPRVAPPTPVRAPLVLRI
ncbi:MAG: hypothetical protein OEW19_19300 [Acidobacteriota bacterium]|nr:hypothetical protein [Acidobacteriota bacterium]